MVVHSGGSRRYGCPASHAGATLGAWQPTWPMSTALSSISANGSTRLERFRPGPIVVMRRDLEREVRGGRGCRRSTVRHREYVAELRRDRCWRAADDSSGGIQG